LSDGEELGFDLFKNSKASWSLMKLGFDQLMLRYPKSTWNLNVYAAFACRANDGATERRAVPAALEQLTEATTARAGVRGLVASRLNGPR